VALNSRPFDMQKKRLAAHRTRSRPQSCVLRPTLWDFDFYPIFRSLRAVREPTRFRHNSLAIEPGVYAAAEPCELGRSGRRGGRKLKRRMVVLDFFICLCSGKRALPIARINPPLKSVNVPLSGRIDRLKSQKHRSSSDGLYLPNSPQFQRWYVCTI